MREGCPTLPLVKFRSRRLDSASRWQDATMVPQHERGAFDLASYVEISHPKQNQNSLHEITGRKGDIRCRGGDPEARDHNIEK